MCDSWCAFARRAACSLLSPDSLFRRTRWRSRRTTQPAAPTARASACCLTARHALPPPVQLPRHSPPLQVWIPQLLLLCFASKILTEANVLLNLQDNSARQAASRQKVPPLPFLLSSLITSRPPRKVRRPPCTLRAHLAC